MRVTFKYHTFKKNGEYVKDVSEVPYWRLYLIRIDRYKIDGKWHTRNTVVYKPVCNYNYIEIIDYVNECPPPEGHVYVAYARMSTANNRSYYESKSKNTTTR